MMRAFIACLLVTMATGLTMTRTRPLVSQRASRSSVQMIYGARNPTGPFAGAPAQVQWRIEPASENVQSSFYVRNGEDQVLGAGNLLYQADGVEQVQGLIKSRSNGDTALVGMGKINPIMVRSVRDGQWGQWDLVYKGQNRWLFSGDQISLDAYNPEAAIFQVTEEINGMDWASWQNGMAEQFRVNKAFEGQGDGGQLPPGWYTTTDPASGQTYYCNQQTGECQWEAPTGY